LVWMGEQPPPCTTVFMRNKKLRANTAKDISPLAYIFPSYTPIT